MDPREKGPKPPHATTSQEHPGTEAEMDPKPDYGEKSYMAGATVAVTGGKPLI